VSAQVTVPTSAACIELSETSVDFLTVRLGASDQPANDDFAVINCSGLTGTFFARGTDAIGIGGEAWALDDSSATCADTLPLDTYHLSLRENLSGSTAFWRLGTTNKVLQDLPGGQGALYLPLIDTACPGSTGGGNTMAMQILLLATVAE
jgi:hypothetical protein